MSATDAESHFLTLDEVAERYRLSRRTVERLVAGGRLPAIQPGGPGHAIRIDSSSLEARFAVSGTDRRSLPAERRAGSPRPPAGPLPNNEQEV